MLLALFALVSCVVAPPLPAAHSPNFAIFNARNVGKINLVTIASPTAGSQNTHTFPVEGTPTDGDKTMSDRKARLLKNSRNFKKGTDGTYVTKVRQASAALAEKGREAAKRARQTQAENEADKASAALAEKGRKAAKRARQTQAENEADKASAALAEKDREATKRARQTPAENEADKASAAARERQRVHDLPDEARVRRMSQNTDQKRGKVRDFRKSLHVPPHPSPPLGVSDEINADAFNQRQAEMFPVIHG
jgi:hypothetical protein